MLLRVLLLIGYWYLNRYVNCFTLDWNKLAFVVPETVINLIVGRCFCYHETCLGFSQWSLNWLFFDNYRKHFQISCFNQFWLFFYNISAFLRLGRKYLKANWCSWERLVPGWQQVPFWFFLHCWLIVKIDQTDTDAISTTCFYIRFRLHALQKIYQEPTTELKPLNGTDYNIPIISPQAKHPKPCFDIYKFPSPLLPFSGFVFIPSLRKQAIFLFCQGSQGSNYHSGQTEICPRGAGDFLMSGIRVCATDQGRFFTSKNPEQAPNFVVLLQNRPYFLKFYSRTGSFFDNLVSSTLAQISKIRVAFGFCFLQPDVFTFVLLYLSKVFQAFYNWDQFESGHLCSSLNLTWFYHCG